MSTTPLWLGVVLGASGSSGKAWAGGQGRPIPSQGHPGECRGIICGVPQPGQGHPGECRCNSWGPQPAAPSRGQTTTRESIGLSVVTLTPQIARGLNIPSTVRGVVVSNVSPSSDAAQRGIQRGDVILSINGRPTLTPEDAAAAVDEARRAGRSAVRLYRQRGSNPPQFTGVELLTR